MRFRTPRTQWRRAPVGGACAASASVRVLAALMVAVPLVALAALAALIAVGAAVAASAALGIMSVACGLLAGRLCWAQLAGRHRLARTRRRPRLVDRRCRCGGRLRGGRLRGGRLRSGRLW